MNNLVILAKNVDGGTGTFLSDLLTVENTYADIQIKTLILEKPKYRNINENNIEFFNISSRHITEYSFSIDVILLLFKEAIWFFKKIYTYKPKIIITIDSHALLLAYIITWCVFPKPIIIATVHNNVDETLKVKTTPTLYLLIKSLLSISLSNANQVVAVSNGLAESLLSFFKLKNKPLVIPYGIDVSIKKNVRKKNQKIVILSIARFVEQKDHKTLLYAFKKVLQNSRVDCELWLVGDGSTKIHMKNLAKQLHISSKVIFYNWVQEPFKLLSQADIFVLSSKREGFPYSILEAFALGIPVISTDAPYGPSELLQNGRSGILVPIGDVESMKDAIISLTENKIRLSYYSKKSLQRSYFFTKERMVHQYTDLISSYFN